MRSVEYLKSQGVDVDKSLEIFGDIETYNSSIGEFIVGVSEKVNKMNAYRISKDMKNYSIFAHSLKSDAKYFGFNTLSDLALEMETKSKEMDLYYVNDKFNDLVAETNKSIAIVREYMNGKDEDAVKEEAPVEEEKEEPKTNNAVVYDKKTILVVDDSSIIRNFVKRIFSEEYEVGTAMDGQEAIDILEANKDNDFIETILLDLNMPRVDGFAVLDYMKENNLLSKFPVSIISGDSSKETIDKAFNYQIVDMLSKPFNEQSVKSVIEKTLVYKGMV